MRTVPFNIPFLTGSENKYLQEVFDQKEFAGNGPFTKKIQKMLEGYLDAPKVLLTHSCTAALELAAILAGFGPEDEVLVPSFTFVTSASAILRTGANVIFCEVDPKTMLLDIEDVKRKLTSKTKGIVAVDYAGFSMDFNQIKELCDEYNLICIEDAAQGLGSSWNGNALGTNARFGTISFHQTKNIHSGLGGCLIINNIEDIERSEVLWERGTNRSAFFKGLVDKYSWQDIGSSFYPSELQAAFLYAQLEGIENNLEQRMELWDYYEKVLTPLEKLGHFRLLRPPTDCLHNAHMMALIFPNPNSADAAREFLNERGVQAVIHYVPLHASPMGKKLGFKPSDLPITLESAASLIRLPMHLSMTKEDVDYIYSILHSHVQKHD
ncbi:MAG: dTDP-4-amino-4,6-dideoxygalactose transaminase [Euryarchaeota archaeon]|nr:dTDP-4-amino-4,6-dideoxygalactose transaminase [Euryarchaeota archaeon]|tara:strand:- start:3916 stop:5058 length:1143 start_codon:yes stop_codon:yes gene_type:complete